ncbi:MAG: S8 family serine peptidase [Bdellovibrionales bacterium]|nr:S8 family serine peptidase [Bdellovibrionales bacterium]
MKLIRSFIIVGVSFSLIHCSKKSSPWETMPAPQKESDLGYIVTATESEMTKLQSQIPGAKVRRLSVNIFEVSKVDPRTLTSFLTNKSITKNQLIEGTLHKLDMPSFKAKETSQDASLAIETCQASEVAPDMELDININPDTLTVELGQEVKITATATAHESVGGDVRILWDVVAVPSFSSFKIEKGIAAEQTFTPDSVGMYRFAVIAQDKNLSCSLAVVPVFVTANPAVSQDLQLAQIPTADKFVQLTSIEAPQAWNMAQGEGIVVAVIDTGLNYNHPGIRENIAFNTKDLNSDDSDNDGNTFKNDFMGWDFVNGDNLPFDDEGHGSHVSGLVASPIMGVAPKAKILPIKALNAGGSSDLGSIVAAVRYAVDAGAHVINMSLSFEDVNQQGEPAQMREAIEYARSKNVVVLAASGNGNAKNGIGYDIEEIPNYPASFQMDNVISVAATAKGKITGYSNFNSKRVHLAAPGGSFVPGQAMEEQELLFSLATLNPADRPFAPSMGTSMATPVAAGLVALMLSANPTLNPVEVRDIMMNTGDRIETLVGKTVSGNQINAKKALLKALDLKLAQVSK